MCGASHSPVCALSVFTHKRRFRERLSAASAGTLRWMRLSDEEMGLFEAACADPGNDAAQELINLFGAESAIEIMDRMVTVPIGILIDVITHLWYAINFELRRQGRTFEFAEE